MSKKCNLISGAILTMTLALASFQTMAAPIEGWVDNTADFDIAKTNRWDINNNQDSRYRLDITNNSNKRIERPYRLAFENLTPGVQVQGAKYQPDGTPYLDLSYLVGGENGDGIDAQATWENLRVTFLGAGALNYSFDAHVYVPEALQHDGCQQRRTIDGDTYCFDRRENAVGHFTHLTIAKSDGKGGWLAPKVVLSAGDLEDKNGNPERADVDFTQSQLRSNRWFSCPSTGKQAYYVKRHGIGDNGEYQPAQDLLRAVVTNPAGKPDSPYTDSIVVDHPYGYGSGDLGTYEENNTQYILTAESTGIMLMELKPDCSDVVETPDGEPLLVREFFNDDGSLDKREAPSLFKHDGLYYIHTSQKTGWRPNQHKFTYATSLQGPWSEQINIGDETAYHSQVFGIGTHNANDGSGNYTKIFSGGRNAAIIRDAETYGALGHGRQEQPVYFNKPGLMATNYYDYIVKNDDGSISGFHRDHGQKLEIVDHDVAGHPELKQATYALVDGDLETSFETNDETVKAITYDLGEVQKVKTIKVRNLDIGGIWNNFLSKYLIETSIDGQNWDTVWDRWVLQFAWLQPLNVPDTDARYVRMTQIVTTRGNQGDYIFPHRWGFYELEIWGNDAWTGYSLDNNGDNYNGFTVEEAGENTEVSLVNGNISLVDDSTTNNVKISSSFAPQHGADITFKFSARFNSNDGQEYIRVFGGNELTLEFSRNAAGQLTLAHFDSAGAVQPSTTEVFLTPLIGQWYDFTVKINLDARTFDVFEDDKPVWGGEWLLNKTRFIDRVVIGTSNAATGADSLFDNISVKGPSTPNVFTASMTAPADDSEFKLGETIELKADATSTKNDIKHVEFFVNGKLFKLDTTAPYTADWTPTEAASYSVHAIAVKDDDSKVAALSRTVTLIPETENPASPVFTIAMTAPADNSEFSLGNTIALSADALSSENDIKQVNFFVNGKLHAQSADAPYSVDWTPTTAGNYSVHAIAVKTDDSSISTSSRTVIVNEQPVVDVPVVDVPVVDEPVVDEPVVDEPVVDEPVIDVPVVDGSATEQTGTDGTNEQSGIEAPANTPAKTGNIKSLSGAINPLIGLLLLLGMVVSRRR